MKAWEKAVHELGEFPAFGAMFSSQSHWLFVYMTYCGFTFTFKSYVNLLRESALTFSGCVCVGGGWAIFPKKLIFLDRKNNLQGEQVFSTN